MGWPRTLFDQTHIEWKQCDGSRKRIRYGWPILMLNVCIADGRLYGAVFQDYRCKTNFRLNWSVIV